MDLLFWGPRLFPVTFLNWLLVANLVCHFLEALFEEHENPGLSKVVFRHHYRHHYMESCPWPRRVSTWRRRGDETRLT